MRKKLRNNARIILSEVPACRQAGMFYDNSLKLGKKRSFKPLFPYISYPFAFRHLPFTLLYKLMEKFTK